MHPLLGKGLDGIERHRTVFAVHDMVSHIAFAEGLKVPAPTCKVTWCKDVHVLRSTPSTAPSKCNPAVGAATEPGTSA